VPVERGEDDTVRRFQDLDAALGGEGRTCRLELEQGARPRAGAREIRLERIRVEAGEVGEPPVLLARHRKRERAVALDRLFTRKAP
jgi:hypothetical protein